MVREIRNFALGDGENSTGIRTASDVGDAQGIGGAAKKISRAGNPGKLLGDNVYRAEISWEDDKISHERVGEKRIEDGIRRYGDRSDWTKR